MRPFRELVGENPRQKIVDIGANPINGEPVYTPMLRTGNSEIVGFEPNPQALTQLLDAKLPNSTFLPYAIGDGGRYTLNICAAPGMTSLLEPNPEVLNLFHGFPAWGQVIGTALVDTVRLDDIPETKGATFIQLDIQGAELMVLQNSRERLKDALVLHCEVEFLPLYKNQPLFSEVEQFLREQGFVLHKFSDLTSRILQPMLMNNSIYAGLSQTVWADAVFVKDITKLSLLSREQLLASAAIMHDCYLSVDLAMVYLLEYDRRTGTQLAPAYFGEITKPAMPAAPAIPKTVAELARAS